MSSNSSSWPFDPSSYSLATGSSTRSSPAASSSSSASTSAYGESNEGTTPDAASNASDNDGDEGGKSNNLIVGISKLYFLSLLARHYAHVQLLIVIPIIVLCALLFAGFIYLRRKKRNLRRQRGFRLGSDHDLPPPTFIVDPSSDPFTDIAAHPVMSQAKDSRVSLFLPSETVFTRSSNSRSSFTTNSVSTGSISAAPYSVRGGRQARLDQDPYGQNSLFTPSTAGYDSRSSAAYTYDDEDDDRDPYDESISPFSDINRPARTLLATRNNLHNTHDSRSRSRSTYYTENDLSGDETDSVMSGSRRLDPDVESLITLSSRVSKLSRRAPSSSGATYGGAHDDEEEEDYETEMEGEEDAGFETEQGEQSGFETEGQDDELSIDERDSMDAISLTSTSHRP